MADYIILCFLPTQPHPMLKIQGFVEKVEMPYALIRSKTPAGLHALCQVCSFHMQKGVDTRYLGIK